MAEPPIRLNFEGNARDGGLYIGFAKMPRTELRAAIIYGRRAPLDSPLWYRNSPLLLLHVHDRATYPSGRFDEGLAGARGAKPTKEQVTAYSQYIRNYILEINKLARVTAAWGWSGRLAKSKPDPKFAAAWVEVIASLGTNKDPHFTSDIERMLDAALKELAPKDQPRGTEVLAIRASAIAKQKKKSRQGKAL